MHETFFIAIINLLAVSFLRVSFFHSSLLATFLHSQMSLVCKITIKIASVVACVNEVALVPLTLYARRETYEAKIVAQPLFERIVAAVKFNK